MSGFSTYDLLSFEAQLILSALQKEKNRHSIQELVKRDLDWQEVQYLAQYEKIETVLWRHLQALPENLVPEFFSAKLEALARFSIFRLLQLEHLLHRTVKIFNDAGIEVVLLKGAGLAYSTYNSFVDRPMSDIDLLVREKDAQAAWNLALENGWKWDSDQYPFNYYKQHQHLPPLKDAVGSYNLLEVHTKLCRDGHPFDFSQNHIWRDVKKIRTSQMIFFTPSTSHQLLHCCIHYAWSHELLLKSSLTFQDVSIIAAKSDIDWPDFVKQAKDAKAKDCCYWTLRLAKNIVGANIPETVLKALRPNLPEFILIRIERHFAIHLFPSEYQCNSVQFKMMIWRLIICRGKKQSVVFGGARKKPTQGRQFFFLHLINKAVSRSWLPYLRRMLIGPQKEFK